MTLREIIYDIKERLNAYSDDILLSDEHIAFMIRNKRNLYLKNYMSNLKKEIPIEAKQLICLPLMEDDLCEDDYTFLKTTVPIPATLETTGRSNILAGYLGSRVARWINIVNYEQWPYIKTGGRFNAKQIYLTIDPNSFVLVYSPSGNHEFLEEIKLQIVAEDPEEADKYACMNDGEVCDFYDKQFPVEASMVPQIVNEIINELTVKYKLPFDNTNNAEDNTLNSSNDSDARRRDERRQ